MNQVLDKLLAQNFIQGFNLLTLIGFVVMGIGLNQSRQGRAKRPVAIAGMVIGTVLVFLGMYFGYVPS
jgi:hypothetical protein